MTTHGLADVCDLYASELRILTPPLVSYGGRTRCSGTVVTVRLDGHNQALRSLLQSPGEGRVAVIDSFAECYAVVGDKMASYAIENNWAGLIIHGYLRDTRALQHMPIAVWARGTCPRRGGKKSDGLVDVELMIGQIAVKSGDYVYADEDGIAFADSEFDDITFGS